MINATINEDGNIILTIIGKDLELVSMLPKYLEIENLGDSLNFKTGRKHLVLKLKEAQLPSPTTKRKVVKQSKNSVLLNDLEAESDDSSIS